MKDELAEFNILLYFGRTNQAGTELNKNYCTGQTCGSLSFQTGSQTIDLNRPESQSENTLSLTLQLENAALHCEKVRRGLFFLYFCIKVLIKSMNMAHLYFLVNIIY